MNKSLYHIRQDHLILLNELEINEGEITEEIDNALSITKEEFENKAVSIGYVIKSFENNINIVDKEIKRLQDLKKRAEARQEMIKKRLSEAMNEFGYKKLTTPTLSLFFSKSESVYVEVDLLIPEEFKDRKEIVNISKSKIKEAIKNGEYVPGARLEVNKNLQIK